MIKRNKKFIKIILCSLAITGILNNNANAINNFKNTEINSSLISTNLKESEDERKLKLVQEYQNNKFLKDFADMAQDYEENESTRNDNEKRNLILEISQKAELAKKSGTLSQLALNFIDEVIKDLEPTYSNVLNEAKNKGIKPVPVPHKESKDDIKPIPKEKQENQENQENQRKKQEKKREENIQQKKQEEKKQQEKAKESLPKTGTDLGNMVLTKIGAIASLIGIYIMKNKK